MFVENLEYAYSYINQKYKIIRKIFYCYFYSFHYAAYKATACFSCNRVDAIQKLSIVFQEFSENFPEWNVRNKTTIWKNVEKYCEEGTKKMQSKLILGRGLFN